MRKLYKKTLEETEGASDQEWTTQRNCQYWVHKKRDEDKQNKYIVILIGCARLIEMKTY